MCIRSGYVVLLLVLGFCAPLFIFGDCGKPAPAENLYSIPNSLLRGHDFSPYGLVRVHDYGYGSLVQLAMTDGLPPAVLGRISAVEDPSTVSYRSFSVRFNSSSLPSAEGYAPGVYLLALFGPIDLGVRAIMEQTGLNILDSANPFGLLVRGDSRAVSDALALCTTEGYRLVRAVFTLPIEARLSDTLHRWASGELPDLSGTNLVQTDDGAAVKDRARERHHLTSAQAGALARRLKAKKVIPVHLSPKYLGRESQIFGEVQDAFTGKSREHN